MRTPGVLAVLLLVGSTTFASAQGPAPADRPDPVPVSIALGLEEAFAAHRIVAQRCLVWGDRLDRVVAEVVERDVFRRNERALLLGRMEARPPPAACKSGWLRSRLCGPSDRAAASRKPLRRVGATDLPERRLERGRADRIVASADDRPDRRHLGRRSAGDVDLGVRKRFGLRGLPLAKPRAD